MSAKTADATETGTDALIGVPAFRLHRFRFSQLIVLQFFARRTMRVALMWATIFGLYVASSALGFAKTYTTESSRQQLATSFGNNIGLKTLLGEPFHIAQVTGFTAWRTMGTISIVGSIWGLLLATKSLRGEEDTGRWELLLTGRTTARRATTNVLLGIGAALAAGYVVTSLIIIAIGHAHTVEFSTQASLFFALALYASVLQFASIGALLSQIMPTRSRAASSAAALFGVFFVLRAAGDVSTHSSWLLNLTPLGWIDKMHPLTDSQPQWLLPIGALILVCSGLSVWLAGRRDLGDSLLADRDQAQPHTRLLNRPFWSAVRLTRTSSLSWLTATGLVGVLFGTMTKSAAQAFAASDSARKIVSEIASSAAKQTGADAFLGIIFFMMMTILMLYVAGAVGTLREDEAQGYLDNLLVGPVSRTRWLWGRILIIASVAVVAGMLGAMGAWLGAASQHTGVPFGKMVEAGINTWPAALLALGLGIFAFGYAPRISNIAIYTLVAWSFLLEMIGSILNLNHWILDTSVLHHVALVPAVNPNWQSAAILSAIGLLLATLGVLRFHNRDLETE